MEYLWDSEPEHADFENDIVCLGKFYNPVPHPPPQGDSNVIGEDEADTAWPTDFLNDVDARIWMTYRTSFPLIPRAKQGPSSVSIGGLFRGSGLDMNGFRSDVGWGCMIRTSQSLLANSLMVLKLGREWRRPEYENIDRAEAEILELFVDTPTAPFSLHNFVWHGEAACGKMPGEWFGPSAAASSIKALQNAYSQDMQVYISNGSDVYENHFMKAAVKDGEFRPTLVLLGLRLGIDSVNKVYWDSLKYMLSCSQAVGIAGGRPSSSHYFYGYQGDYLFYLDPHFPRPCLSDPSESGLTPADIESVHTNRIRRLHLDAMDPSMLVGILIKDQADWDAWKHSIMDPKVQKIIHISPEPLVMRRSSVSTGNDDDEEFVDVMLEPEDDTPVIIDSIREEYDKCQDYEDEDVAVAQENQTEDKQYGPEPYGSPTESKMVIVDSPRDNSYDMTAQSIFLMDHLVETSASRENTPEANKGVVLVDRLDDESSDLPDERRDSFEDSDCISSSPVAVTVPKHTIPNRPTVHSSNCSISSSPVKISRSYITDQSSESEDWEYMAKSDVTIQKSSSLHKSPIMSSILNGSTGDASC